MCDASSDRWHHRGLWLVLALFSGLLGAPSARAEPPSAPYLQREYELVFAPSYDLYLVSTAAPTLNRMTQDVYLYGIGHHLPPAVDGVLGTAWSAFFTYTTMLWPHEFGHWNRAQQVDSKFIFHNAMPLLPRTTVEMPADATDADKALLSVGGFEVNTLVARQVKMDFYEHGGAWSDELAHGLLNEMFFPVYALAFPARAQQPVTWRRTRGDPVHFVLPVYERYSGRPPVNAQGDVDPELVRFYREAVVLSLAWAVADPGVVQEGLGFFDPGFASRRAWMPVRTERFGWTWGTQFNPSPLGYELYLHNYLVVDDRTFEVAARHGRPMKNNGIRLSAPDLLETDRLQLGLELEGWDQDEYGIGALGAVSAGVEASGGVGVVGWLGYKTRGYVLGRAIEQTPFGALGLRVRFDHGLEERGSGT